MKKKRNKNLRILPQKLTISETFAIITSHNKSYRQP